MGFPARVGFLPPEAMLRAVKNPTSEGKDAVTHDVTDKIFYH